LVELTPTILGGSKSYALIIPPAINAYKPVGEETLGRNTVV